MRLFLDDVRVPEDCLAYMYKRIGTLNPIYAEEWEIARTYEQFKSFIIYAHETGNVITHVSFDHDLADMWDLGEDTPTADWFDFENNKEYTGYDCAKFLKEFYEKNNLKFPVMFVHSMNPIGTERIIKLFQ